MSLESTIVCVCVCVCLCLCVCVYVCVLCEHGESEFMHFQCTGCVLYVYA